MNYKTTSFTKLIGLSVIFSIFSLQSYGQNKGIEFSGYVRDDHGQAISGATIRVSKHTVVADSEGKFTIDNLQGKEVTIEITRVGKKKIKQVIPLDERAKPIVFTMNDEGKILDAVDILGLSKVDQTNKQAYNVTAIDAKKLHNSSTDVGQALNRISGVKLKEAGGLGSQMSISLNGFTGNQVKLFMDGLPLDNEGSSFQLNNIPINYVSAIEVYKGVVPVWLGGDAIGGAINLVKSTNPGKYLDVSYSHGSFNTHRATVNAGYIGDNGFTMELNAYQNYSDNNYWVDVDLVDKPTGQYIPTRVRRFHDNYKNKMVNFNIGWSNKSWADQLLFGINIGDNRADIQTGNRMYEVYGERFKRGNLLQPTIQYKKNDFLLAGLDVSLRANYDFGEETLVDTVFKRYFWDGSWEYKAKPEDVGGERSRQFDKYKNNRGNAALNLKYTINEHNHLFFNNTLKTANRKTKSELDPDNPIYDQSSITNNNIASLGFYNNAIEKLDYSIFVKYFYQQVKGYQSPIPGEYLPLNANRNLFGYGMATSYHLKPTIQLKLSYEKAYRIPELNELFGNVDALEGNQNLKPESSHNINLGINYLFTLHEKNAFNLNGGVIYRKAMDFIRLSNSNTDFNGIMRQVSENIRDVNNMGFDFDLRYSFDKKLFIGGNFTYQNLRNGTEREPGKEEISVFYKDRIPNIPYLYGSAEISYMIKDLFIKQSALSIGYSLFYVNSFYLRWPSAGAADKEVIPTQVSHDANITYSFHNGRYNIGLDVRNLTDATLYDNYMLQKPSRNFNVKFRYVLNNLK